MNLTPVWYFYQLPDLLDEKKESQTNTIIIMLLLVQFLLNNPSSYDAASVQYALQYTCSGSIHTWGIPKPDRILLVLSLLLPSIRPQTAYGNKEQHYCTATYSPGKWKTFVASYNFVGQNSACCCLHSMYSLVILLLTHMTAGGISHPYVALTFLLYI